MIFPHISIARRHNSLVCMCVCVCVQYAVINHKRTTHCWRCDVRCWFMRVRAQLFSQLHSRANNYYRTSGRTADRRASPAPYSLTTTTLSYLYACVNVHVRCSVRASAAYEITHTQRKRIEHDTEQTVCEHVKHTTALGRRCCASNLIVQECKIHSEVPLLLYKTARMTACKFVARSHDIISCMCVSPCAWCSCVLTAVVCSNTLAAAVPHTTLSAPQ